MVGFATGIIRGGAGKPQFSRVVTLRMVDELHQRPEGTAKRNFNEHRGRLLEGVDYFEVPQSEFASLILESTKSVPSSLDHGGARRDQILLAESGYLLLVKSLRDDLAWQVQRMLVNEYFRSKGLQSPERECPLALQICTLAGFLGGRGLGVTGQGIGRPDAIGRWLPDSGPHARGLNAVRLPTSGRRIAVASLLWPNDA
jgi:hypothetical protein